MEHSTRCMCFLGRVKFEPNLHACVSSHHTMHTTWLVLRERELFIHTHKCNKQKRNKIWTDIHACMMYGDM